MGPIKSQNTNVSKKTVPSMLEQIAAISNACEERPAWDSYFMATAMLIATRSSCERLQVGCVLVSGGNQKNRIIAAGYNGFLPGAPHVSRVRDGHEQATVHAEQNAVSYCAKKGISCENADAYITHYPCINCAKILLASGIKKIYYINNYKNDEIVDILAKQKKCEIVNI